MVVSSMLQSLITRERASGTHLIEGLVGPRASLNAVAKGLFCCSCQESKPSYPAHSLVTIQIY